ncbi:MFS transporter [Ferroplasma acidiphilum]|uniref:MFS transporter n=1 Tax=Ferroplasma acidiphilum TaxID=74969 RepID=UPI0023F1DAEC|nr:MFS transporter [Ferroplasma acidiphilum]
MAFNITGGNNRHYSGILGSSIMSFSMNSTLRFFIPVLIPLLVSSLNISVYLGSLLITAYWLGYTVFQIPAGMISDRVGVSKVAKISFILMVLSFSLFYFFIDSYTGIFIIQILLGSFSATVYLSDTSVIQKWLPQSSRATFVGIYQTGFFIGASLGEYLILRTLSIGFRFAFIVILSILIIATILNIVFLREPEHNKLAKHGKIDRKIIYVAMIRFSAGFLYIGFITLFTTFIVFDHIVPYSSAYLYAWIPAAGGIITSPLGGMISRRMKHGKSIVSVLPVVALAVTIIYINYAPVSAIFIISFLSGMFYGLYAGPSMGMASDFSGSDANLASSSSILNFSSQVGGTVSPLLMGFMFSIYGNFALAFTAVAAISIITLIIPFIKLTF